MAPLDGAVTDPHRPGGAKNVGNDLDFNVAASAYHLLHKNRELAERRARVGASAGKSCGQLVRRIYPADAVAAAPGCSLNQQGIAQTFTLAGSLSESFYSSPAPRHDRHLRLLRQPFGGYLVA